MNLTEGCTLDLHNLVDTTVVTNVASIVGYVDDLDQNERLLEVDAVSNKFTSQQTGVNEALVSQGRQWGKHIAEHWNITVFVGVYLLISVGFSLPLFSIIATIIYRIYVAAGGQPAYCTDTTSCYLSFNPRQPEIITGQPAMYSVLGLFIQLVDAVWYIYLAKVKKNSHSNLEWNSCLIYLHMYIY
jgi:ABC-type sugar transport system permease subunit